jgi:hypothetical protein
MIKNIVPNFIFLFLGFIAYRYYNEVSNGGGVYKTGDWLINYSAGPIRRGLIGTLLFYASELGLPLRWVTYTVQILFYLAVFFFVLKIYRLREREWAWTVLLFSPAFLLFPFYDFTGAFRKEIIVFAAFSYLCFCYAKRQVRNVHLVLAGSIFILAAFSHELTVFTLPFFIYLFYRFYQDQLITKRAAVLAVLVFSIVSLCAASFAYIFPGDPSHAAAICKSVLEKGFDERMCGGAIGWLGHDAGSNIGLVNDVLLDSLKLYVPLMLLSILPIFFVSWVTREAGVILLIGMLSLIPLFIIATDWGRWIHIYIFFLFSIILAESIWKKIKFKAVPPLVVFLYLTTWSIPHFFCGPECNAFNGFISKVGTLFRMIATTAF